MKFRCSQLGALMTEPRSKSETISETAKSVILERYIEEKYNRTKEFSSKYTEKGIAVEEDAITLLSLETKTFFSKNEKRLENEYITGLPDLYVGELIENAKEIIDIKSSWDIFTFFKSKTSDINKTYFWQMQGYMMLTGAKKATLAYCLVSTPQSILDYEMKKVHYQFPENHQSHEKIAAICDEIEKLGKYDDIARSERIFFQEIDRDEEAIEKIKEKVTQANKWLVEWIAQKA